MKTMFSHSFLNSNIRTSTAAKNADKVERYEGMTTRKKRKENEQSG